MISIPREHGIADNGTACTIDDDASGKSLVALSSKYAHTIVDETSNNNMPGMAGKPLLVDD